MFNLCIDIWVSDPVFLHGFGSGFQISVKPVPVSVAESQTGSGQEKNIMDPDPVCPERFMIPEIAILYQL